MALQLLEPELRGYQRKYRRLSRGDTQGGMDDILPHRSGRQSLKQVIKQGWIN